MPLFMTGKEPKQIAGLLANFSSLVLDFCARVKVGGTHLTYSYLKQFPVLPPDRYSEANLVFIVSRVLELTYTAHDLAPWAQDLGYDGEPFVFDPVRRAQLRAELDAWYARLYGLTRDELRYILDPADIMGEDYPSETFRVLKSKELKEFDEYRTRNLVLREFDRMKRAEAQGEPYISLLNPPPGQHGHPSYSTHGIVRDEVDARLLGLLLTMVQQRGRLSRRHLTDALALASQASLLGAFADAQGINVVTGFGQRHPTIFEASRATGARIHTWFRHLESVGVIRLESQTDQLVAVSGAALPIHVLTDDETARVAVVLLQAAEQASASAPASESSADTSVKRA